MTNSSIIIRSDIVSHGPSSELLRMLLLRLSSVLVQTTESVKRARHKSFKYLLICLIRELPGSVFFAHFVGHILHCQSPTTALKASGDIISEKYEYFIKKKL